jgi:hypothetical protein
MMSGTAPTIYYHLNNVGGNMQFLSIREFNKSPKTVLSILARDGKAVLTNNGKQAAFMLNVDSENFERVFNLVNEAGNHVADSFDTFGDVPVARLEGDYSKVAEKRLKQGKNKEKV